VIRPDNAQAYYNRGLLYQSRNQHQYAIDDFTTAIGLSVQQAEPYVARGLSYIAVKRYKDAADDLDSAVGIEPQNVAAWTSRGLAYERLGDKEKAAGSYARAMNINRDYKPASAGFERVGGKMGEAYQTF
jgi:Tfp pilus assembly protein PilF